MKPKIKEGWYRLKTGTTIQSGDAFWSPWHGFWNTPSRASISRGEKVLKMWPYKKFANQEVIYIRKIKKKGGK